MADQDQNDPKSIASPNQLTNKRSSVTAANLAMLIDSDDDDDDDDDQDDLDDDKIDALIKTEDSQPLTTKDVTNMILEKLKNQMLEPMKFSSLTEALETAQEDQNHLIFIVYCVDWFNLARQTYDNFQSIAKDKDILVFFINQSSNDYVKENYNDIAGIPTIKVYYKQIPIKIKRNDLEYEWTDEERLKGFISPTNLQELVNECKDCKNSYDSQQASDSILPLNLEVKLGFLIYKY
ncbi:hypothetical protein PPL_11924 [Heterostelium album PN500]|uniref:Thioredoxin-like protein n=1 Tax=Heterostelium pallidum (strain ATCC 26659 / Pp 5 / PN500) TaxID=670386 RepID=D3BUV2_HETP5|nr:hypothetical protein PPL_11924 [Heterostelium album PN500]EFA74890.1 hypothetical protein PPL_11924 [Heterostelium album PN500]|eukprot:XP_020427024.1 hypothetical protein PPL_11924 [Heterostelium album PN500]